ncbi:unnamed protein product (macronuclear) [Paramecium tetraurelia]|uniref:Uncharacterized protein n=1 Tax=Paramecium tetraurelia TaxID=5888 RepID=A0ECE6_PARTE|nr:uncharacterized protein GSPATT00003832001 [Paramecium tetraurelia]CAK92963.1 unnamed protein product [Paramecium tetraurelia]|eukprot:XP_001460360.1 hypothetical protein (macronuclear) [Paramecium tetraurelia strain d4-2]
MILQKEFDSNRIDNLCAGLDNRNKQHTSTSIHANSIQILTQIISIFNADVLNVAKQSSKQAQHTFSQMIVLNTHFEHIYNIDVGGAIMTCYKFMQTFSNNSTFNPPARIRSGQMKQQIIITSWMQTKADKIINIFPMLFGLPNTCFYILYTLLQQVKCCTLKKSQRGQLQRMIKDF